MHSHQRLTKEDWIAGLTAGALLGALFLGVGGRAGMRVMALADGQTPFYSVSGSLTVVALGALNGAVIAAIFLVVRILLPTRRWLRAALFWMICCTLIFRGLSPVTPLRLIVFLPLFGLHGAFLHLYWCRIHLAQRRGGLRPSMPTGPTVATVRATTSTP